METVLPGGGNVTVAFLLSAGLTNATEAGDDQVKIRTPVDTDDVPVIATTPVIIELSTNSDSGGESVTLLAKGADGYKFATFWRDADGDCIRDAIEVDLCTVVAISDDTATCIIRVGNPPSYLERVMIVLYRPWAGATSSTVKGDRYR